MTQNQQTEERHVYDEQQARQVTEILIQEPDVSCLDRPRPKTAESNNDVRQAQVGQIITCPACYVWQIHHAPSSTKKRRATGKVCSCPLKATASLLQRRQKARASIQALKELFIETSI